MGKKGIKPLKYMALEGEEWRDIPTVPGYQVSNIGRVRGKNRLVFNRGRRYIKRPALCRQHEDDSGYFFVRLSIKGHVKKYYVHRLVLLGFIGLCPADKEECDHRDRDRKNNKVANLHYVTRQENNANRVLNPAKGEKCNFSKLTRNDVIEIKTLFARKGVLPPTFKGIASKYGVSASTISKIVRGVSWTHLKLDEEGNITEAEKENDK